MALGKLSNAFHCRDVRTGRSMHHLAAASGERGFGCLEACFLSQKKNIRDPFPGREAQELDWRLPKVGRGTKRNTWPTLKDAVAS